MLVELMNNLLKIYKKFSGVLNNLKDIVILPTHNGLLPTKILVEEVKIEISHGDLL